MTWTDNHGKRMRTWIPEEVGTIADPQEFMDTLVSRAFSGRAWLPALVPSGVQLDAIR